MILKITNISTQVILETKDKLRDDNPLKLIKEYLSVRVDGYEHSQAYKAKRWDGYKSFFAYQKFPSGFLPMILKYLDDLNIIYTLLDERENQPKFLKTEITSLGGMDMYDYQIEFLRLTKTNKLQDLPWHRGIIDAATNAGKNLITAAIFANLDYPRRCLFTLHDKLIYAQAVEYFGQFFDVGQINDKIYDPREFTVAMYQSTLNQLEKFEGVQEDLAKFNMLICDEAHMASSKSYSKLIQSVNAGMRLFISGTSLDHDSAVKNLTIVGLSGQKLGTVTNQNLIDKGVSLRPIIHLHLNKTETKNKILLTYVLEQELAVLYSLPRLEQIKDIIRENKKMDTIISFIIIEHGEFLLKHLSEVFPDLVIKLIHGTSKDRKQILLDYKAGKIHILIGSKIMGTGLNIPNIKRWIRAEGGKSKISTKQIVGRTVRKDSDSPEETTVEIHDFYDVGKYIEAHSRKRALTYKREGFEMITHYKSKLGYIPVN